MDDAHDVQDEHFGMVDAGIAKKIADDRSIAKMASNDPLDIASEMVSVKDLILGKPKVNSIVELEEFVYRVYNKRNVEIGGVDILIRTLVLGTQGENVRAILFAGKADIVNQIPIERGDKIILRNFVVKRGYNGLELASIDKSTIMLESKANTGINDFSKVKEGMKEIDIVGKVVSIDKIKHPIFSTNKDNDTCNFTISDLIEQRNVSVVGNAIRDLEAAHPGDFIKIEFAQVRANGKLEFYLNESSRILVSQSLRGRLRA